MINVVDLEIKNEKKKIGTMISLLIPVINVSEIKTSNNHTSQVQKTEAIMLTMNVYWKITKFKARF